MILKLVYHFLIFLFGFSFLFIFYLGALCVWFRFRFRFKGFGHNAYIHFNLYIHLAIDPYDRLLFRTQRTLIQSHKSLTYNRFVSFLLCKLFLYVQFDIPVWFQSFCVFRCVYTHSFVFTPFVLKYTIHSINSVKLSIIATKFTQINIGITFGTSEINPWEHQQRNQNQQQIFWSNIRCTSNSKYWTKNCDFSANYWLLWIMSFRSRSRTVQPVVQRRSLSGSRLPNNLTSSYTSNRPMSSAYPSSTSYSTSNYNNYSSPYTSITSRDSIYSSIQSSPRNSYFNGSSVSRRDSYNGRDSYSSRDSYNGRDSYNSSTIYKNPYTSDRYISPYTSYENGVTTAGLSLKSSAYSTNGYTNKSAYTPLLSNKSTLRHSSKHLSASNTSLNSYSTASSITANAVSNASIGRSQSFRDQTSERKSRGLRRNSSLKSERSLSVSSEKSEGYEVYNDTYLNFVLFLCLKD